MVIGYAGPPMNELEEGRALRLDFRKLLKATTEPRVGDRFGKKTWGNTNADAVA